MRKQTAVDWLMEEIRMTDKALYNLFFEDGRFEQAKQMEKQQIEISDEEITKQGFLHSYLNELPDENAVSFIQGAKWYREQLKKK